MAKVKPYNGDKPYIFISYAHKNTKEVMPIIERMISDGYRVWYDEGIDPGTEWDEFIANQVANCGCMIAIISKEYMESENCRDELNFARDEDKPRLLIYLNNVTLPMGMRMRLNRLQAIHKYTYDDEADFYDKLYDTDIIVPCKGTSATQTHTPSYFTNPQPTPAVSNSIGAVGEKAECDVILTVVGDKKLNVIKVVKEELGLGLKETVDLVNSVPKMLKKGVSRNEAMAFKSKLEEVGATVEIRFSAEEKTRFDVVLTDVGDKKLNVIKVVKEELGLGIVDAKKIVEGTPKTLKKGASKNEAMALKKKLEEVGATVEIK